MRALIPEGDSRTRSVCQQCSFVDYQNPRIVAGAIVEHSDKILLCRRGIQPQRGLWTVPAGFLELGESTAEGAARETMEEAGAAIVVDAPFTHFDVSGIGQVYILFRARLAPPFTFAAQAPESLEARLFALDEIPWGELAFSSVQMALKMWCDDAVSGTWRFHQGTVLKEPGSGPNDPGTFKLVDEFTVPDQ